MYRVFGVCINVGSSSANLNGRGRIFGDHTFEYLPIPETKEVTEKVPTYRDLGFTHVKFPDLRVHLDPEFKTFTYGHVKRGFGDISSITRLKKNDVLFFYATLQGGKKWAPYIIGYFRNLDVHDCRKMTSKQILSFRSKGFGNNAHLGREDAHVDFMIKGGKGSELLMKAFPLSCEKNPLKLRKSLGNVLSTASGKRIDSGKPWFRWILACDRSDRLLDQIEDTQSS